MLILASCSSPEKRLEKKLMTTIKSYMDVNKGKQDVVDSIVILDIDTLTPATYLFLYQQSLLNKAELLTQKLSKMEEDTDSDEFKTLSFENAKTQIKIDSCTKVLENSTVENGIVWGYFVITKVYIKHPDNTPEILDIGFPITEDYKVYEMDL